MVVIKLFDSLTKLPQLTENSLQQNELRLVTFGDRFPGTGLGALVEGFLSTLDLTLDILGHLGVSHSGDTTLTDGYFMPNTEQNKNKASQISLAVAMDRPPPIDLDLKFEEEVMMTKFTIGWLKLNKNTGQNDEIHIPSAHYETFEEAKQNIVLMSTQAKRMDKAFGYFIRKNKDGHMTYGTFDDDL